MLKFVIAALIAGFLSLPAAAAECKHTYDDDAAALKTFIGNIPDSIVASTAEPGLIAAFKGKLLEAYGVPTTFKMEDVIQMTWIVSPAGSHIFLYDKTNCRVGSAKIDPQMIIDVLKAGTVKPEIKPQGDISPMDRIRWGEGNYLRTI